MKITSKLKRFKRHRSRSVFKADITSETCPILSQNFCGLLIKNEKNLKPFFIPAISTRPKHVQFITFENRLSSFKNWTNKKIDINHLIDLAESGFFSSHNEKIVECFFCGIKLPVWHLNNSNEEIWKIHALLNKNCFFIVQMKGLLFIKNIFFQHWHFIHALNVESKIC